MLKQIKNHTAGNLGRIQALSHARLSNYRSFFGAKDDAQALGLYQWNEELSACLFRTISLVEVVLRNQFHKAFSLRYGVVGGYGSKDWYEYVALPPYARNKIECITHSTHGFHKLPRLPAPSPDDVVSRLTFGFWPHLLDLKKDALNQDIDWGQILLDVIPGHRQRQTSHWAKQKHQDGLFARLHLCNSLRNRIAHHEPIWKLGELMTERRARPGKPLAVDAPAPTNSDEALARLRLLYGRVVELLAWLSPDLANQHTRCELHLRCLNLLQPATLQAYRLVLPPAEINLATVRNFRALRKALRYAACRQQPVLLRDGHRTLGHLTSLQL
ncbi:MULTISPECIES: Abi family protein [Achromobacter]|uniref:Abi family protein n=1 Tax=Achromobacter TaxID=222 RepID=UPI0025BAF226|nr:MULTISPECIES: Abi family protein [Achromobacter]